MRRALWRFWGGEYLRWLFFDVKKNWLYLGDGFGKVVGLQLFRE